MNSVPDRDWQADTHEATRYDSTRPEDDQKVTDSQTPTTHRAGESEVPDRGALRLPEPANWRYRVVKLVGRGGMSLVYMASDVLLNRPVAIKTVVPRPTLASVVARRLLREAFLTAGLQHPGIPPVHDAGYLADGRPYIVMKLVEGVTLSKLLKHHAGLARSGVHSEEASELLTIFERVCEAVAFAHQNGVIHRDLKPGNVMIGRHGEVHVMDWGLGKRVRPSGSTEASGASSLLPDMMDEHGLGEEASVDDFVTRSGCWLGTPPYMAPEQVLRQHDRIDERTDVFGLGAMLYHILVGEPPFPVVRDGSAIVDEHNKALSKLEELQGWEGWTELCRRCMSLDPEDRFQDAGEVAAEVRRLRADADRRAREAELRAVESEVRAREIRKRTRLFLGICLLVIGVLGVAMFLIDRARMREAKARAEALALLRTLTEDVLQDEILGPRDKGLNPDLLDSLLDRYRALADLLTTRSATPALQGEGHLSVGTLCYLNGDLARAENEYRQAIQLLGLAAKATNDPAVFLDLGRAWINLSLTLSRMGQASGAEEAHHLAIQSLELALNRYPNDGDIARTLALALINGRKVLKSGNSEGILTQLRRATDICTRLVRANPDDVEALELLGLALTNLSVGPERSGGLRRGDEGPAACTAGVRGPQRRGEGE